MRTRICRVKRTRAAAGLSSRTRGPLRSSSPASPSHSGLLRRYYPPKLRFHTFRCSIITLFAATRDVVTSNFNYCNKRDNPARLSQTAVEVSSVSIRIAIHIKSRRRDIKRMSIVKKIDSLITINRSCAGQLAKSPITRRKMHTAFN